MTLREQLLELAEPAYRDFNRSLMPGVEHVIGIRLPQLRRIAREIARGDWRRWLAEAEDLYFEERMLQGLVIGYVRCPVDEWLEHVARFVPKIDNWAVCDCFCRKLRAEEREPMWRFVQPFFRSEHPYEVRFAVVTALVNFIDGEHLDACLERFEAIRLDHYYVRMGVAWAVSVCFVRFPERIGAWLHTCRLDDWTYNKALQKIAESLRVDASVRQKIRAMRRPSAPQRKR